MAVGTAARPGAAQGPHGEGGDDGMERQGTERQPADDRGTGDDWLVVFFGSSGGGARAAASRREA